MKCIAVAERHFIGIRKSIYLYIYIRITFLDLFIFQSIVHNTYEQRKRDDALLSVNNLVVM